MINEFIIIIVILFVRVLFVCMPFFAWNSIYSYLQLVQRKQNGLFSSISKSFNGRRFKVQLQIVPHLIASLFRLQSLILNKKILVGVVVVASIKHRTPSTANNDRQCLNIAQKYITEHTL